MTRAELDKLKVGDRLIYHKYLSNTDTYYNVDAIVYEVHARRDSIKHPHDGLHNVFIRYQIDGKLYHEVCDPDMATCKDESL